MFSRENLRPIFNMKIFSLPLLAITLLVSVIAHIFIFSFMPDFASRKKADLTMRDLKFLLEEVVLMDESGRTLRPDLLPEEPLAPVPLKTDIAGNSRSPFPPKDGSASGTETPETSTATAPDLAPPWEVSPRLNAGPNTGSNSASTQSVKKNEPDSSRALSLEEARAKLKELEKELSLKTISRRTHSKQLSPSVRYVEQVRDRIQAQYFVPAKAQTQRMTGRVVLQLTIASTGEIKKLIFLEHSDFPVLDMAAHAAIESAAPFPNINNKVDLKKIVFNVPFVFE